MINRQIRLILAGIFILLGISTAIETYAITAEPSEVLVRWKGTGDIISVLPTSDVDSTLAALQVNPAVDHVEANGSRQLAVFPNDTYADSQYHLKQSNDADIDAGKAWDTTIGTSSVIVAVIDTGVDLDHPDLVNNIWTNSDEIAGNGIDDDGNGYIDDVNGWDFVDDDNDPNPTPTGSSWTSGVVVHGTHVAGLIGAEGNNAVGTSGVNWRVSIMPVRVFTDTGDSTLDDIYNAVNYAANSGADIINMSYGGGSYSRFEQEAIEAAYDKGALSVAAAGNESANLNKTPSYPICHPFVLGVSATDATDARASFTNYGTDCVDVAAPGDFILSTYYTDDAINGFTSDYGYLSGTSMSAPIVSGIAALAYSAKSDIDSGEMMNIIIDSTDSIHDDALGSGRVNAYQAVVTALALNNPQSPSITAYHNKKKKKTIAKKTRTRDTNPYFVWKKPRAINNVVGYYVYWGDEKKNPVTHGNFQTKKNFSPKGIRGNEKNYRLRIKAVDSNGEYSELATFKYISDTKIKQRPTIKSIDKTRYGINITWGKAKGEHIIGYYIYRAIDGSKKFEKYSSLLTQKEFTNYLVVPGHTYKYKVRSVDDIRNESDLSKSKSISL